MSEFSYYIAEINNSVLQKILSKFDMESTSWNT